MEHLLDELPFDREDAFGDFLGVPIPEINGLGAADDVTTEAKVISDASIPATSPSHHSLNNGNGQASDDTFGIRSKDESLSFGAVPDQTHPRPNPNVIEVEYKAAPTVKDFIESKEWVTLLMGPVGSAKSSGCVMKLIKEAHDQEPSPDGVRRTRFAVIRNEFPTLWSTTVKTVQDWVPHELGVVKKTSPPSMWLRQTLPDNTSIESEWLFLALDNEADNRKLLSLELTGAWVNECKEVSKSVLDLLETRVGRFPSKRMGSCTHDFIILDTNPPDVTNWVCKLFRNCPTGYKAFFQPSGLSDAAENLDNLPGGRGYYERLMQNKSKAFIEAMVHGRFAPNFAGKAIYDAFDMGIHVLPQVPKIPKSPKLCIGLDFGLQPSACIGWVSPENQLIIIDEMISTRSGILQFGTELKRYINEVYPNAEIEIFGDPAGNQAAQTDMRTPYDILAGLGINAQPAHTNDFQIRIDAVMLMLTTLINGKPWLVFSPKVEYMISAFAGGYCWRKLRVSGDDRYADKPDKGPFSHIAEAGQYLALSFNPQHYANIFQKAEDMGNPIPMSNLLQTPVNMLLTPRGFTSPLDRTVHTLFNHKKRRTRR